MSSTIIVPKGFGYTGAAILSTAFVLFWQGILVGALRKKAGIAYPQAYAEKAQADASKEAFKFNCAHRAHQNTLENTPMVLITTVITAIKYPVVAAALCGLWSFSRVLYTLGYIIDPKKRNRGAFGLVSVLGLLFGSSYTVYDLIRSSV